MSNREGKREERGKIREGKEEMREEGRGKREERGERRVGLTCHVDFTAAINYQFNTI